MKVYIKPWKEALECAEKENTTLVQNFDNCTRIFNISQRCGDWGHILEATKDGEYYTIKGYGFIYPSCCVEEITPNWLEEHASKFSEEVFTIDTWDNNFENYETHRITIYKAMDARHAYFFYVYCISYNGCEETVEDFREIN